MNLNKIWVVWLSVIMHVYNNTKVLFMNFGNQNFNIHVLKDPYNFTEVNIFNKCMFFTGI